MHINMPEAPCLFSGPRVFGSEKLDCYAYSWFVRRIQPILVEMWGLLPSFPPISCDPAGNRRFLAN